jgi:hypothetical protein
MAQNPPPGYPRISVIEEPADQRYGDRRYASDPEGHRSYFASRLGD